MSPDVTTATNAMRQSFERGWASLINLLLFRGISLHVVRLVYGLRPREHPQSKVARATRAGESSRAPRAPADSDVTSVHDKEEHGWKIPNLRKRRSPRRCGC